MCDDDVVELELVLELGLCVYVGLYDVVVKCMML